MAGPKRSHSARDPDAPKRSVNVAPGDSQARKGPAVQRLRAKHIKALDLLLAGHTYTQIARQLGYHDGAGARKAVHAELDRHGAESTDARRTIEGARLDELQATYWPLAITQLDIEAAKTVLNIMRQRAALFGLNAPVQVEHTVRDVTEIDARIQVLVAEVVELEQKRPPLKALPPAE